MDIKFPHVQVPLIGADGNAFNIIGLCKRAAQRAEVPPDEIEAFMQEATAADYTHLLATCQRWFDCH